jgi:hypothetical protein
MGLLVRRSSWPVHAFEKRCRKAVNDGHTAVVRLGTFGQPCSQPLVHPGVRPRLARTCQCWVRRVNTGVLLDPVLDAKEWFARLDSAGPGDFMAEGREQPITPSRKILD